MTYYSKSEYSRGVNSYSRFGRLFQVEYARSAVKLGSTSIGIRIDDGVLITSQKRSESKLIDTTGIFKIKEVDSHLAVSVSGLIADSVRMVNHARVEAQNHRFVYNDPLPVESTTQAVCDLALKFGSNEEGAMSRPFGVALLIGGVDKDGPQLFVTDPSGSYFEFAAKAIGAGSPTAQDLLDKQYRKNLTLKEAEELALKTLKLVMIHEVSSETVDIVFVKAVKDETHGLVGKLVRYSSEQVKEIVDRVSGDELEQALEQVDEN